MTPFAINVGTYDSFIDNPLKSMVGHCLPIIWQESNGKLRTAYSDRASTKPDYTKPCSPKGLLATEKSRIFGLVSAYDRRPGLGNMAKRKLDLTDGLPRTQKRLNAWQDGINDKPSKRRGDLYLTEWRRVHHPQVYWLTNVIDPKVLWLAFVLPDGRMLLGPAPLVRAEMAQYLTYGWDTQHHSTITAVIELCRAGLDVPYEWRKRAVVQWYKELLGKFGYSDYGQRNGDNNAASWAQSYFSLNPKNKFWQFA